MTALRHSRAGGNPVQKKDSLFYWIPGQVGNDEKNGFTLVELLIVMVLTMIIATSFYTFFKTNLLTYLNLQKDATSFTDIATQSQRIANVVRGLTDITSVADSDLVFYSYFYPSDTYVSLVHYYLSADSKTLLADITPMTSNPPIGTPIIAKKKTYTVISSFKQTTGLTLFNYLDASGSTMTLPITDLHTIKGIKVNLAAEASNKKTNQAISLTVSLRNRKTNL